MAKWERTFFRMASQNVNRPMVSGPAYRGLALLRVETGLWSLTHMKSGMRITQIEGDYSGAKRFGEAIAELTDWDAIDTADDAAAIPGLLDRMRGVFELFSGNEAGHA